MIKTISPGLLLAGSLCGWQSAQAADSMKPGLWEYEMKMDMPGLPVAMPPVKYRHCLTQADVDQGNLSRPPQQKGSECQTHNLVRAGDKISYDITCTGEASMSGHYDFTATDSSMEGGGKFEVNGQHMQNSMRAKRLSDCK